MSLTKIKHINKPRHIAIIMDGNGRWAKNRGKLRIFGHKAGVESAKKAIKFAINNHLNALTLYAFSSENWKRPIQEVSDLMELFSSVLNNAIDSFKKNNIRLKIIGDISKFNLKLQKYIKKSEKITYKNNGLNLNIAANYGGRWDIIQGVKKIAKQVKKGIIYPDQINESNFCRFICMNELVPVDLVIRTGGEHRISNFLLWQIAYSELFFTDVLWPDFDHVIFSNAINSFAKRERRFGKINSKCSKIYLKTGDASENSIN
ncbi:yaeS [Wigglesworthia glossinidia endosymbiont of Glossina brevipalpis]|uniref:Ditrans,polycis-undecaprenyl-diphosphate synthase ((2E,6E)-farnesyl-diphosphate specific) n=1 Tax=Wigglesworthia glossinidia brevipalpis TaxID=36870 RepID=UPPS_WIGBR|nr:RecName: Full=Ditrans,polycis-undecaprenyl-diphosphate synthase ((2E,6E)-farnesyl-diphosphate specific); AltName: Full=Ditrans,polycis-undecaprenylcistransferase; AltName: Full=Undecaprenyl diphosphate synthase; Short=UDS; AltName: Full=Undecaprenyl pyrophosphate synthase; Short=UPP synthase [Wigglesworthia glossinidia endosymbiont of Glossina brevipalpis]BAC24533.1 yaeS [Wigglesworthia glossinidia endosymbiont of Glossina brevipalpis]